MNYRFSKLSSCAEDGNTVVIDAHVSGAEIKLFEDAYKEEYKTLQQNGGTNTIASELEQTLYEHKVLIETETNEVAFLENAIEDYEKKTFGLIILPTEECNLRCVYCYEEFHKDELTQAHYDLLFNEIVRRIEKEDKKQITLAWFGGEPLLKADAVIRFNERVQTLTKDKGVSLDSSITTNGVTLDMNTFESLCQSGVLTYQITLDGFLHDKQRVFPNGEGSFDIIFKNITAMLESSLDFKLMLRVNIADADFDFSFYDLFQKYTGDNRLQFLIKAVGKWGEREFDLPVLEKGKSTDAAIKRHHDYLKKHGYFLYDDERRGILSESCYAARRDLFVIRASGKIGKCTVALNDEFNDFGYLDLERGVMEIDYNIEDQWSYNIITNDCKKCKKLATCANRSCPYRKLNNNCSKCCDRKSYE